MKMPNLHAPHFAAPHFAKRADPHEHHHRPAFRTMMRVENGIDLLIIALVVVLALAMIYGLVTATGHPAYFDRWPS